ncbi:MAG: hypothetical protein ABIA04_06180 [Pseudomonadota bacterium]
MINLYSLDNCIDTSNYKSDTNVYTTILEQDVSQDGLLCEDDFAVRFGKTAARACFDRIKQSIKENDISSMEILIKALSDEADLKLKEMINEAARLTQEHMNKLRNCPSSQDWQKEIDEAGIFANYLTKMYESEFPGAIQDKDNFIAGMKGLYLMQMNNDDIDFDIIFRLSGLYFPHKVDKASLHQLDYAYTQFQEETESAKINEIEAKYGIDIRRDIGVVLSNEDLEILDQTLAKLRKNAPEDFEELDFIFFRGAKNETRGGGQALRKGYETYSKNGIELDSPFAAINPAGGVGATYSEDFRQLSLTAPKEVYFEHLLTHELGHLSDKRVGGEAAYENIGIPIHDDSPEIFAEDYRLFQISGGKEVMSTNGNGEKIPFYEERLEYFKTNFN